MRRRRISALVLTPAVAAVLLAGFGMAAAWPSVSRTTDADAVVVFGGDHGERLSAALDLIRAGRAPVLVLAERPTGVPPDPSLPEGVRLLRIPPQPSTHDEAREFAALAREQHWRSLLMVTSTYHAARAHLLLRHCFPGPIHASPGRSAIAMVTHARVAVHELFGLVQAYADRSC